jgi:hypothetical protein
MKVCQRCWESRGLFHWWFCWLERRQIRRGLREYERGETRPIEELWQELEEIERKANENTTRNMAD